VPAAFQPFAVRNSQPLRSSPIPAALMYAYNSSYSVSNPECRTIFWPCLAPVIQARGRDIRVA
jgi:hypothetical protein